MSSGITVAIPSIPPRAKMLTRALESVAAQRHPADAVSIAYDVDREGAARTRDRAVAAVLTPWTAFLDDDDEFYSTHLQALRMHQETTGADLVYPWFNVIGGTDPFPHWEGVPFEPDPLRQVPITYLIRTDLLREVGGFTGWHDDDTVDEWGNRAGEDYYLMGKLVAAGAKIVHLPQRTWIWHHDSHNTSGRADRW